MYPIVETTLTRGGGAQRVVRRRAHARPGSRARRPCPTARRRPARATAVGASAEDQQADERRGRRTGAAPRRGRTGRAGAVPSSASPVIAVTKSPKATAPTASSTSNPSTTARLDPVVRGALGERGGEHDEADEQRARLEPRREAPRAAPPCTARRRASSAAPSWRRAGPAGSARTASDDARPAEQERARPARCTRTGTSQPAPRRRRARRRPSCRTRTRRGSAA